MAAINTQRLRMCIGWQADGLKRDKAEPHLSLAAHALAVRPAQAPQQCLAKLLHRHGLVVLGGGI